MACCAGKKSGGGGNEISADMKEVKVEKFDELFKDGSAALAAAEDIRAGLQDSKAAVMSISGAYTLKTGGMSDALKCWLWSVGAEVGADKLANMKPEIKVDSEPHFNMELDPAISDTNKEFYEAFKCWCDTCCAAPDAIKELTDKLKSVSEKAQELSGTAKDECSAAGLGMADTAKAIAAIGGNSKALATGMTKLGGLGPVAQEAGADMKDIAGKMAEILKDAVKNSDEGKGKGAKSAAEFCEKQHDGEKLDAKQAGNDTNHQTYTKNKAAGKKLPAGGKKAAPAGDAAPAADAPAAPEDVKPEVKDV